MFFDMKHEVTSIYFDPTKGHLLTIGSDRIVKVTNARQSTSFAWIDINLVSGVGCEGSYERVSREVENMMFDVIAVSQSVYQSQISRLVEAAVDY